ncbi:hypothetical protein H5410_029057 [Solanum commersonii]|uniref:Retrovirus-related Pol polyprotein from transposon TNT 1-94-like beta-barrel domain-containing protein n=1 Tax=Solanum commersonii TaxID=4109 RepID=A0A9J5Z5R1_SOLCO|nr:hypothetical protein H5410_029057 [Solanum commersonii]
MNQFLTKEEYSKALQYYRGKKIPDNSAFMMQPEAGILGNVNATAGISYKHSLTCLTNKNSSSWIIDSGASENMCFNHQISISLTPLLAPMFIILPNMSQITITHRGNVPIFADLVLENVLYVLSFKYNLLSVDKFVKQFQSVLIFTSIGYSIFPITSPYSFDSDPVSPIISQSPSIVPPLSDSLYLPEPPMSPSILPSFSHSTHPHPSSVTTPRRSTRSVEVHIINGLPNNDKPAKIHCESAKDDLGYRYPKVGGDFEFHFHPNDEGRSLFFCRFWWGDKHATVDVYTKELSPHCSTGDTNYCIWVFKEDGFYFGPSIREIKKMYDWNN